MGPSSSSEPFTVMEVHLIRQVSGFGFRIIGGQEEGSQVARVYCVGGGVVTGVQFFPLKATVGCIVAGGAADLDGRLMAGDEITHINHRSVMDSTHRDVIALMGEAAAKGEVTLRIQRKMPMPGVCVCVCANVSFPSQSRCRCQTPPSPPRPQTTCPPSPPWGSGKSTSIDLIHRPRSVLFFNPILSGLDA